MRRFRDRTFWAWFFSFIEGHDFSMTKGIESSLSWAVHTSLPWPAATPWEQRRLTVASLPLLKDGRGGLRK